jgi:hypothetical protein
LGFVYYLYKRGLAKVKPDPLKGEYSQWRANHFMHDNTYTFIFSMV